MPQWKIDARAELRRRRLLAETDRDEELRQAVGEALLSRAEFAADCQGNDDLAGRLMKLARIWAIAA